MYIAVSFFCLLLGVQVKLRELRLLTRRYNYRVMLPQSVTYIAAVASLLSLVLDLCHTSFLSWFLVVVVTLFVFATGEWLLSRLSPSCLAVSWIFRLLLVATCCLLSSMIAPVCLLSPFVLAGLYLRNTPFGAPHIKCLCLETYMKRNIKVEWGSDNMDVADYAGRKTMGVAEKRYDVRDFGVVPSLRADQSRAIQRVIDMAGRGGGGVVFFPKGKYLVNKYGDRFLQINHSNVTLEGEVDRKGRPVAEIVGCRPTVRGHKNPWISPFLITTGEALQPSNEFWGLDFRKKRQTFTRSNSLSDPGSDGKILTPEFATTVTATASKGSTRLCVADSGRVGKYILLGMYNTSADGNLIKDILGMDELRPEWTDANRAGEEEAPSYQWLVEVKTIVDAHTIELVRPLLRDCDIKYTPAVYNVEMLENITIRNLQLSARWNGTFRHHGFPLYYTIRQTQQMDYGWNAINMKRVAHSEIDNVIIKDFSNPIYVLDSRNVTVHNIWICGHDGHQGLKIYMHACDNLFENITFTCHFADMMGGEGNAYGNVFRNIVYNNPEFNPVDYDFHGFASPSMSPPADNLFTRVYGFRYMKHAGALYHMPSAAQGNTWTNTETEGEQRGEYLFYNMTYRQKRGQLRFVTAVGYAVAMRQKNHRLMPQTFVSDVRAKLAKIDDTGAPRSEHQQFIPRSFVCGIKTLGKSQF